MDNFLISVLAMIVVLGFLVLIHEFGHFAVAKLLGVRVEQFAIGFGKRLFGIRKGGTDYRINLIPLGGYVKMAGENLSDAKSADPGDFTSHPRWQRFLIAIAGPAMNILFAIAVVTGINMVRYAHPAFLDGPAVVGYVKPGSPVAAAGIQEGDRVVRIANDQNPTWEDVMLQVALSPHQPINLAVQRGDQILDKTLVPDQEDRDGPGEAGLVAKRTVQVAPFVPQDMELPAAKAGMRAGDIVAEINGRPLDSIEGLIAFLAENKTTPVEVTVLRDGQPVKLIVTPVATTDKEHPYRLGFTSTDPNHIMRLPFTKALAQSLETNKKYSMLILELVERLVRRRASVKQLVGPIGIGAAAGQAAREGWLQLLGLAAMLSLNLGLFNLLPIPILDGGLVLLLFIEALMRRDISQTLKERIYQVAFAFLIFLVIVSVYNDVMRQVPGLASRVQ